MTDGILITAGAILCCVSLRRAAEVAKAKVPAANMADTGEFLLLVEVLGVAAELPAAAFLHSTSVPAILSPVLRTVFDLVHAETFVYETSVKVPEAPKITRAMVA